MRKVKVYNWKHVPMASPNLVKELLYGEATFHAWGVDYEELQGGVSNYSTAIVELPDGSILNHPAELIQFID